MAPEVARGCSWGRVEMAQQIADVPRQVLPS